ncbi:hypothetical protein SDJN03_29793, partial [Cucurbita argyrosperma subsp. sororia]
MQYHPLYTLCNNSSSLLTLLPPSLPFALSSSSSSSSTNPKPCFCRLKIPSFSSFFTLPQLWTCSSSKRSKTQIRSEALSLG